MPRPLKHLLVDITAHGYGHIAQTAPVLNLLARRLPGLRLTIRSHVSTDYLRQRILHPFEHIRVALDFGMAMVDAVQVDVPRSLAVYRDYHADWAQKVATAAEEMRALQPDLVLANVPYLSLAAAKVAGIPAVAMCCLNWADIYRHYAPNGHGSATSDNEICHARFPHPNPPPEGEGANESLREFHVNDEDSACIHAQMLDAYNSAAVFLQLTPTMPMHALHNMRLLDCVAQVGTVRRDILRARCGAAAQDKLVLVAMGGIAYRLPMENWPTIDGVRWLVPAAWGVQRADVSSIESLAMDFCDVLASCDALLTKPGYGTFAEAACAGIPVMYVARGDWPEAPYLVAWLQRHGVALEVNPDRLQDGELRGPLEALWAKPRPAAPQNTGAAEVVETLCRMLT